MVLKAHFLSPLSLLSMQAHLNGKKYRKMKAQETAKQYDFAQHAPHIVQHKTDPRKLFCHRTKLHLNKVPAEVEVHVKGRRFRARLQEWEEKQKRRADKAARVQAKAEYRDARKAALAAAGGGSDEEEDPVLAKFAHLAGDDDDDEDDDDDDFDDMGIDNDIGIVEDNARGDGQGEMDAARSSKEQYKTSRAAAKAQEQVAEEDDGEFEVVSASEDSDSSSEETGTAHQSKRAASDSEDDSEPEPEPTAAKKLSVARHAARQQRDDAAERQAFHNGNSSRAAPKCNDADDHDDDHSQRAPGSSGAQDASLPDIWHHGAVVQGKHHGRSGKPGDRIKRSRGIGKSAKKAGAESGGAPGPGRGHGGSGASGGAIAKKTQSFAAKGKLQWRGGGGERGGRGRAAGGAKRR